MTGMSGMTMMTGMTGMNEWMIFLMSKTWEVFTQSSEPEAHVKNGRQTKKYKSTHTSQDNR